MGPKACSSRMTIPLGSFAHTHSGTESTFASICQYVFILQLVGCESWMKFLLCVSMNKAFPDRSLTCKAMHTAQGETTSYICLLNPHTWNWTLTWRFAACTPDQIEQPWWTTNAERSKVKFNCLSQKFPKRDILDVGWMFFRLDGFRLVRGWQK